MVVVEVVVAVEAEIGRVIFVNRHFKIKTTFSSINNRLINGKDLGTILAVVELEEVDMVANNLIDKTNINKEI